LADESDPTVAREKRVGDYLLGRKLGSGGFGAVFEAQHASTRLSYAIKRIALSAEDADRFEKEALYPARIAEQSLYVIRVQDFFHDRADGHFYLVTELIPHGDLRDHLSRQPRLEVRSALELAIDVARGLAAIHKQGIVHLDLKPRNILMDLKDDRWVPKIADFGLARSTGTVHLNRAASVGYGAPEQWNPRGTPGQPSDLFAFGMIAYEVLVGRPASDATNVDQYLTWLERREKPVPPSVARPELARWRALDVLIDELL
jgi:serine/threonine-protein kinase